LDERRFGLSSELQALNGPTLEAILLRPVVDAFQAKTGRNPTSACFDVAGPVIDGRTCLTILAQDLDEAERGKDLGPARVTLLNDLNAIAHAIPHLKPGELACINPGKAKPRGSIAVMAPGTGLGEAFLIWSGTAYVACPSEGGHRDGPANEVQAGLWSYLTDRFRHVAYERVAAGICVQTSTTTSAPAIHRWKAPLFAAVLQAAEDRTPLIIEAALQNPDNKPLAAQALRIVIDVCGAQLATSRCRFWQRAEPTWPEACRHEYCRSCRTDLSSVLFAPRGALRISCAISLSKLFSRTPL